MTDLARLAERLTPLPCPFCGRQPDFRSFNVPYGHGVPSFACLIRCEACSVEIVRTGSKFLEKEVRTVTIDAWNRRVPDPLSHAAGVNAGLEMAAKWHEGRSEILQVRAQQFADEGNNDSARLLDVAARDHRESAASIRALKSPSKETEHG